MNETATDETSTAVGGRLEALVSCDYCEDGDGQSVFPYYGVAPHTHDTANGMIGSTRLLPKDQWPANFREDPDAPGCGTYTHCPRCGAGS